MSINDDKCFQWIQQRSFFIRAILNPIYICKFHKVKTFLWFMFVIVAGQLVTIINIIQRTVFDNWPIGRALIPDSLSGNFYTFSLVLLASLLGPLFIDFIKDEKPHYRKIGMVFVTILIFTIILCAVFYSFATHNISNSNIDYNNLRNSDICVDIPQLIFYICALVFARYYFGYSLLEHHEKDIHLSDEEYRDREELEKENLSEQALTVTDDGKGVKI